MKEVLRMLVVFVDLVLLSRWPYVFLVELGGCCVAWQQQQLACNNNRKAAVPLERRSYRSLLQVPGSACSSSRTGATQFCAASSNKDMPPPSAGISTGCGNVVDHELTDSPLSQLSPEELELDARGDSTSSCNPRHTDHDELIVPFFSDNHHHRNNDEEGGEEDWLDTATKEILNGIKFPLGQLSMDDVESIAGIMAAWARRRSVDAAIVVEQLLKRVVDDMKANNTAIKVSTRLYTIAIDAWAKSGGASGTAQRAQHIHDAMVQMYQETADESIAPSSISYNTLINAWGKSSDPEAPIKAERVLHEMIHFTASKVKNKNKRNYNTNIIQPDAITFSTILDTYARSNDPKASERAEALVQLMDQLKVKRNVFTYSALQNVYARSGRADAPEKTQHILRHMMDLYRQGDVFAKPNCVNYNAVLCAFSRTAPSAKNTSRKRITTGTTTSTTSAKAAVELLKKMEMPVEEGGFDVEPDRLSYAMTILTCARCPDEVLGARMAEENLQRMEHRACLEKKKRQEISSAAPPSVVLDIECFNVVLTAISRCRQEDAVNRTLAIVRRMEQYANSNNDNNNNNNNKYEHIRPTVRSWNAVLNALSRASADIYSAQKAEEVLNHMYYLYRTKGLTKVKPDAFSFAAVLGAYQKSSDPSAVDKADDMLRRMEKEYENGEIDTPPDVFHYTIVCSTWARSKRKIAPHRCLEILSHMANRAKKYEIVKPNVRTYNAVLDCLSKSGDVENAEKILYYMLKLYKDGDKDAKPDQFSFNSVINAFCRCAKKGSGRRAEAILERFLEYHIEENHPNIHPDARSFTQIIAHYGRSRELDAPYRAEYLLNRMVALFKSGVVGVEGNNNSNNSNNSRRSKANNIFAPNTFAITTVMDTYSKAKHPDSGVVAERLLSMLLELRANRDKYGLSLSSCDLRVDTSLMNSVLLAWVSSGDDDAGRRAEIHLEDMERKFEATGNSAIRPTVRSYGLVLNAWAKSSSFDKAERALRILRSMEKRFSSTDPPVQTTPAMNGRRSNNNSNIYDYQQFHQQQRQQPNEHAYSLVINACAFTNSGEESERNAFQIAASILDEMLESKHAKPSSLTYGWFLQACGRLAISQKDKEFHIQRAFTYCCVNGLVNDFVLYRLKGAVASFPVSHLRLFLGSALSATRTSNSFSDKQERPRFTKDEEEEEEELYKIILMSFNNNKRIDSSMLPYEWTKNAH